MLQIIKLMISRDSAYDSVQGGPQIQLFWVCQSPQIFLPFTQEKTSTFLPLYSIFPTLQSLADQPSSPPETTLSQPQITSAPSDGPVRRQTSNNQRQTRSERLNITSAKKNSEHNLASQFGSFFRCRHKSEGLIRKILAALKITADNHVLKVIYWSLNEIICRMRRKYISMAFLKNIGDSSYYLENYPELVKALHEDGSITLENFCRFIRITLSYYLKNLSTLYILTSKKLKSVARLAHLQRQRQMLETLVD